MLAIAILAAGKGSRMRSSVPKVLQPLGGKPIIERVLKSCEGLKPDHCFVIVGHQAEKVKNQLAHLSNIDFVIQTPQNGTGHAIQQLLPKLGSFKGDLLVLNGDVPLLQPSTIESLLLKHRGAKSNVTLLSARILNPKGYGRVFSDSNGVVNKIIEDRDCSETELKNNLTNAGIYCFEWDNLKEILPNLSNDNSQKEIYLTETIRKLPIAMHLEVKDPKEVSGINNKKQMSECEKILQERIRNHLMESGVTFIDPDSCTVSDDSSFGKDVIIEPQTHIRGRCQIGDECKLGPNTLINNSLIGKKVTVIYSVLNDCEIGDSTNVGPFAHIRPESKVDVNSRIGNFVEIKKSSIGQGSKINHLSYIGDSELGENVNVGAGTITANYDGRNKNRTIIGSSTKTGANSVFVAPIQIGSNVTIGAGSTITKNVPNGALAIGRGKQLIKENWDKEN